MGASFFGLLKNVVGNQHNLSGFGSFSGTNHPGKNTSPGPLKFCYAVLKVGVEQGTFKKATVLVRSERLATEEKEAPDKNQTTQSFPNY